MVIKRKVSGPTKEDEDEDEDEDVGVVDEEDSCCFIQGNTAAAWTFIPPLWLCRAPPVSAVKLTSWDFDLISSGN